MKPVDPVLPAGEPTAGPWRVVDEGEVLDQLLGAGARPGRPVVVAVDGRSASGKSTLADRLRDRAVAAGLAAAVVRTDDVAWHESFFGWDALLREGVLVPLRAGRAVRFRPPAWDARGRGGAVEVPAGTDIVLVEGVGAGRRELSALVDAVVWVQSDAVLAEERGIARDVATAVNGSPQETVAFWHEWAAQELVFLAAQRPWERAHLVVAGTPVTALAPGELAVAQGPLTT